MHGYGIVRRGKRADGVWNDWRRVFELHHEWCRTLVRRAGTLRMQRKLGLRGRAALQSRHTNLCSV